MAFGSHWRPVQVAVACIVLIGGLLGPALYMYTHNPTVLGFGAGGGGANGGGGYAYRQPPTTGAPRCLYTVSLAGDPLVEDTTQRVQYPSYFTSVFTRSGLSVRER